MNLKKTLCELKQESLAFFRHGIIKSGSKKPLFFCHIPKTAGTSFRVALEDYFGKSRICFHYTAESELISDITATVKRTSAAPDSFREVFAKRKYQALSGHVNLSLYVHIFGLPQSVTFVRSPGSRVVSEYRHKINTSDFQGLLEDFYRDKNNRNRQSRYFSGYPVWSIGFVGVTEKYNDSIALINEQYAFKLSVKKENIGRKSVAEDPAVIDQIKSVNMQDQKLYDDACHLLALRKLGFERGVPLVCGAWSWSEGVFSCWVDAHKAQPVLLIDDSKLVLTEKNNSKRKRLKSAGLAFYQAGVDNPPTVDELAVLQDLSGFQFSLPQFDDVIG